MTVMHARGVWPVARDSEGEEDALDTAEVARILRVSPSTVRRRADAGRVPHYLTPGGRRRYREAEIRRLARDLGVEGQAGA